MAMRRSGWESANYFDPHMPGEQHGNAKGSFEDPCTRRFMDHHRSGLCGVCWVRNWSFPDCDGSGVIALLF